MEDEKLVEIRVLVPVDVRDQLAQGVQPDKFSLTAGRYLTGMLRPLPVVVSGNAFWSAAAGWIK